MEHLKHPFPKHTKTSKPSDLVKIIAVVVFVLIVASLVFYFRAHKNVSPNQETITPVTQEEQNDLTGNTENLNNPSDIDLSMVEDDLNQTEKGLKTIDSFENF